MIGLNYAKIVLMKKLIPNDKLFTISPGYSLEQYWDSRETMTKGIVNWEYNCTYQLMPKGLYGQRKVLHLNTIQINHVKRPGGMMHSPCSAQNSFVILVVKSCEGRACFGPMKLHTGDIIFFDDNDTHNFVNNGALEFTTVTLQKNRLGSLLPLLTNIINHSIYDTDGRFFSILHEVWKRFTDTPEQKKEREDFQEAEDEILSVLTTFLSEQTPVIPKLTEGEKTALEIRDKVFGHMDGNVSISSLARQHQISEQTMQTSFKSLFGFTPRRFLRLLKLNHVHQELLTSNTDQTTVSRIASKWGFMHMGHFSHYYAELFGESPSDTLKTPYIQEEYIKEGCAVRREELD